MARVLILGGAGFIGCHLTRYLAESSSDQITLVDNLSRGQFDPDLKSLLACYPSIDLRVGDLTRPRVYDDLPGAFDCVYLLAGIVGVQNVQQAPARVLKVNTAIILNALDWLSRAGCGRLLFASTSEAYAGSVELGLAPVPTGEAVPLTIEDIQQPRSTYALTKMLGEAFVTHFAREHGFEGVVVRFHNIYGPRMGFSHVVPELMQRIHSRIDPLPVYGLDQTRAFCYVADAVRACVALMQCKLDGPQIVNVGNDSEEVSIRALVERLLDVAGWHANIQELPDAAGSVSRRCPDIARLRALTGFRPEVNLTDGLAHTWEWYSQRLDAEAHVQAAAHV